MTDTTDTIDAATAAAANAIPPAWPLAATVAVNPFFGQAKEDLATAAARLDRAAGVRVTPAPAWFAAQLADGAITDADLAAALADAPPVHRPASVAALRAALTTRGDLPRATPTIADLAAAATRRDWPAIIAERFGHFAGAFLDAGQALWTAPQARGAWREWRATATHDLTPEILGLHGFAAFVADTPASADAAIARALATLGVPAEAVEAYCHRLLTTLGGWAQAARQVRWVAELGGGTDATLTAFLAIRLAWEEALFVRHECAVPGWPAALDDYARPVAATGATRIAAIGQDAADRAAQRRLAATLAYAASAPRPIPQIQAAFCIDVRSEVFRRAVEAADPAVQTLGFAGFFGLTAAHRPLASDVVEARLPVLLSAGVTSAATLDPAADTDLRLAARASRAWDRFKLAAVSSFAFVEAAGPAYVVKLVRDALAIPHGHVAEPPPHLVPPLPLETRVASAGSILRAMSLTRDFAPLVVLAGHGAAVVNNPHASALHCGACGGYAGDVNARLLAALLNDGAVRDGLRGRGIDMPAETHVVAALHETTTDTVTLFTGDAPSPAHAALIDHAARTFAAAGTAARAERGLRLARSAEGLVRRSRDWAEVRPEWGLAGCSAFVAAPRARTIGRDLGGRVFLHDYAWADDAGFGVLELILTAPVVVASWISLQYYGSAVAPELFGGGNKLLHNVIGGIGVVEGNGGTLRTGLPWQSVHDGRALAHEPLRLNVVVEAPREAIGAILARHDHVRDLFDNGWLHLFTMDDTGRLAWRYTADGWRASAGDEQLGGCIDDRVDVESVRPIQVCEVAGLTETVDAERTDAVTADAAQP